MPSFGQIRDVIEELALFARVVGATRLTLDALEDDDAFDALCKMGASVHTKHMSVHETVFRTETARLRVHRVDIEVHRPVEACTASNVYRSGDVHFEVT